MTAAPADASAFPAPAPPTVERPPRPAATIVVVRDGAGGIEVLLSRRAERGDHNSGAWVFPGGIVEPSDALAHAGCRRPRRRRGEPRGSASPSGGLDYYVAAIRECFEESGLLFARADGAGLVDLDGSDAGRARALARRAASRRERHRRVLRRASGLRLAADRARLPQPLADAARPRRSASTRASSSPRAPPAQTAAHDGAETARAAAGSRRSEALARSASLKLLTPTQKTLETIGRFAERRRGDGVGVGAAPGRARRCRASASGRDGLRPVHARRARRGPSSAASIPPATATRSYEHRARPRGAPVASASSASPPTTAAS